MTVWFDKTRGGWRYDFWLFNERHTYPRTFESEREATDAEAELRRSLRRQRAGLEPLEPIEKPLSPRFTEIAGAYCTYAKDEQLVSRMDALMNTLFVILQFFGAKPADEKKVREGAPYHDLRLQDPIDDPEWILKFETWLKRRGIAGATKNRYRSACSRLYWFAMLPEHRKASGITFNPFRGIRRDKEFARDVVLTPKQIRAIMAASPPHLRLAIVIASLAPKLRLSNILQLKWDTGFDAELTTIRIQQHKTHGHTRKPMIAPISEQLRRVLLVAKTRRQKKRPWVIHFRAKRRQPIKSITKALIKACADAGVTYGRAKNGATFHTIRHSAATLLAQLGVSEGLRKDVMGHLSIQTTQGYTHLNPIHERAPLEQLSQQLALEDVVTAPRQIGSGGTTGGKGRKTAARPRRTAAKVKSPRSHRRKRQIA